ncbi:putative uncharacterized protein DDB_G0290521 [Hoplias malabaricus]|uniref:putative uncharacterized protein DDB_G0290521 n=1 Tax=Hoplias malabaricus TaxID=27720 RepID=UPI003461C327
MEKITATFWILTLTGVCVATSLASNATTTTGPQPRNRTNKEDRSMNASTAGLSSPEAGLTSNETYTSTSTPKTFSTDSGTAPNTTRNQTKEETPSVATTKSSTKKTNQTLTPTTPPTTIKPTTKTKTPTTTPGGTNSANPTKNPQIVDNNRKKTIFIIIFSIVIICFVIAIVYCCVQKKSRSFSLDRDGKIEDAQMPLSAMEQEVFETGSRKEMETFTATETSVPATSAPPADGVEKQDGEKDESIVPEANQAEKESSPDPLTTAPPPEKTGELTVVDLNDGDAAISTKTSVESLDEPLNENNSNNRALANVFDYNNFIEISLGDLL